MMIFSLVAMIGLDKCCITSACLQWLCHSGERIVARGPLVLLQICFAVGIAKCLPDVVNTVIYEAHSNVKTLLRRLTTCLPTRYLTLQHLFTVSSYGQCRNFCNAIYITYDVTGIYISVLFMTVEAGLGGSVGCVIRLETRRSRVQASPRPATFFRGD